MTPDYNFTSPHEGFIPVLCGNYYFTGAYVYYFPDVSNLDFRTYGYQTNEGGGIAWFGTNYKYATEQELTDKFVSLAQSGYDWGGILEGNKCYPFIQHETANSFSSDTDFKNLVYIKTVSVNSLPDGESTQAYNADVSLTMDYPDWYTKYKYKYVLSGKGSGGLSVVDDKKGNAAISGTPTGGGSVTLTATVTDYSNRSVSASTSFTVSGDSAAEVKSVSISPATSSATQGTAYKQKFTTTCQEGDDGSYSYSWSASGSTSGMSLDNATIAAPTLSGTPTTSGSITLTVLVIDSYGNKATSSSTVSVVAAAPVIGSCSISPTTSTATVGTAYSQVFTLTGSPADAVDHYQWNSISGAATAGLTLTKGTNTATVSGTPTTAGSFSVNGFAYDSYGHYKSATATVSVEAAPVETGTLIPANCSLEQLDAYTAKKAGYVECTVTVDEADDGTYQYYWYANGNGTGLGNVLSESGATITSTWVKGAGTVKIGGTSYNKAGTVNYSVKVKDANGDEYDSNQLNWTIS